ncbi:MAG: peptidase caspase catalytic subunit p20 [Hyphomicrobiales bacterium]|nr:peptidase caspase catalytic subunit p20 [Hyphomicrobiales bacterium]
MVRSIWRALALVAALAVATPPAVAQDQAAPEARFAFVIGNDGYEGAELPTAANDAALVADALKTSGFEVTGARNLDQDTLRASYREFLEKVAAAGPNAVAAVYLSGYGLQDEGENFLVTPGARVARRSDLALNAVRLSDLTRPLSGLPARARVLMFDLAHAGPFAKEGPPLAPGLAIVEPEQGTLISFNAAPGALAPAARPPYGPYAQALAEMMREAGMPLDDVFVRVRARVAELTRGAQAPWHASALTQPLVLLARGPDAPPPSVTPQDVESRRTRPLRDMSEADAYASALARDTLSGYQDFLSLYPSSPYARNVRAMMAARREALTWRRTASVNTPNAYWSYMNRYPRGPHVADARARLARLSAAPQPPASFEQIDYEFDAPPPEEVVWFEDARPDYFVEVNAPITLIGPPPVWWRPPPPPVYVEEDYYYLAAPVETVERPSWAYQPSYVVSPPPPVIYGEQRTGARINPYVAIPAALAVGVVAGKLINDRRERRREGGIRLEDAQRPVDRQPFVPPISSPTRPIAMPSGGALMPSRLPGQATAPQGGARPQPGFPQQGLPPQGGVRLPQQGSPQQGLPAQLPQGGLRPQQQGTPQPALQQQGQQQPLGRPSGRPGEPRPLPQGAAGQPLAQPLAQPLPQASPQVRRQQAEQERRQQMQARQQAQQAQQQERRRQFEESRRQQMQVQQQRRQEVQQQQLRQREMQQGQQRQQEMQRQQQLRQQTQQQGLQQQNQLRQQQQMQQQRETQQRQQQQIQQQRQQQDQQQQRRQMQQQRQQQMQQQQMQQQRQQQMQQQQMQQQRQQQMQQQQMQQQRQQQMQQQRQQQMQQQQMQQQRQQQMQQQQMQQQRQQQMQQQQMQQQRQQQMQQRQAAPPQQRGRPDCGRPGQPACR